MTKGKHLAGAPLASTIESVPDWSSIFTHAATFDPAGDFEAFCKSVPARHVVYLLADEADRPVQLLCVKNLRASLKRRLGVEEAAAAVASKRVNYRELVRRVHWVRVDSTFEADWLYTEAARACFPLSFDKLIGFRPAWFVCIDPQAKHPRYFKATDLSSAGLMFGPIEEKGHATRLIELLEDSFDLCRYHNVLVQSPDGKACAYKEMGKCPAPCDGSISLEQYRRLIDLSLRALIDPADLVREHTGRMQQAAVELKFELARKIKLYVDQLSQLGKNELRFVRPIEQFGFVALQHGPTSKSAKVFLITRGSIEPIAVVLRDGGSVSELLGAILHRVESTPKKPIDRAGEQRLAVVTAHLFATKNTSGAFIPLNELDAKALIKAHKDLQKQTVPVEPDEDEGIVKETGQPASAG